MKTIIILFPCIAVSTMIFANMWIATECVGPPSAMFVFNMTLDAWSMADYNETWPPSFEFYNQEFCTPGGANVGVNGGVTNAAVCVSELTGDQSYQSSSYDVIASDIKDYMIHAADDYKYCFISSMSTSTIFGYAQAIIKEGECNEGITCAEDGTLSIMPNKICGAVEGVVPEVQLLTSEKRVIHSQYIGDVEVYFGIVANANTDIRFTFHSPATIFIPTFHEPWEIAALSFFILALLAMVVTCAIHGINVYKKRTAIPLGHLVVQVFWTAYIVIYAISVYAIFASYDDYLSMYAGYAIINNLATLLSVFQTCWVMMEILNTDMKKRAACFAVVLIVHGGLAGANYSTYQGAMDYTFSDIWQAWRFALLFWNVIVFGIMMAPIGYLLYKVVTKSKSRDGNIV
jgi:hypothetical protein